MSREILSVNDNGVTLSIRVVPPPPSSSNFTDYNRKCADLDSDFLMQPINEAPYDSETQACVDRVNDGPASFYDHYVSSPQKKRGLAVGCECPVGAPDVDDYLTVPPERDLPITAVDKSILKDPVARRLATGRAPSSLLNS